MRIVSIRDAEHGVKDSVDGQTGILCGILDEAYGTGTGYFTHYLVPDIIKTCVLIRVRRWNDGRFERWWQGIQVKYVIQVDDAVQKFAPWTTGRRKRIVRYDIDIEWTPGMSTKKYSCSNEGCLWIWRVGLCVLDLWAETPGGCAYESQPVTIVQAEQHAGWWNMYHEVGWQMACMTGNDAGMSVVRKLCWWLLVVSDMMSDD